MNIKLGDTVEALFSTHRYDTGAKTDADALPVATVYKDGVADALVVTVTNLGTGIYKAVCTPTADDGFAVGNHVSLVVAYAVNGVNRVQVICQDSIDGYSLKQIYDALQGVAVTGVAVNKLATGQTLNDGSETLDYTATYARNNTYHEIEQVAGEISIDYEFELPEGGVPVSVTFWGRLHEGAVPSGGDTVDFYAYDWDTPAWEHISTTIAGELIGKANSTNADDVSRVFPLFGRNVDGDTVKIRLAGTAIEAGTTLYVDQIYVTYAVVPPTRDQIWELLGAKQWTNAAGTQAKVYDRDGNLLVTLDRSVDGSGHITWEPTWP